MLIPGSLENIDSSIYHSELNSECQEVAKLTFLFLTPRVPQKFSLYLYQKDTGDLDCSSMLFSSHFPMIFFFPSTFSKKGRE